MRLGVDPTACRAVGMCAHLAPGVVRLDRWGYPIVPEAELESRQERPAAGAVRACPHRALRLQR